MKQGRLTPVLFEATPSQIRQLATEGYTIVRNKGKYYEAWVTNEEQFLKIWREVCQ